jgi:hypothetical protein
MYYSINIVQGFFSDTTPLETADHELGLRIEIHGPSSRASMHLFR